jgi:hypothetical protein
MRGFSTNARGKKKQIRVHKRDRTFLSTTEGIGAEREFYSKLNGGEETLDDLITDAEGEYGEIHRSLLNAGPSDSIDSNGLARLLAHLSIRGNNLRASMSTGSEYSTAKAMEAFSDSDTCKKLLGLTGSEPSGRLKQRLDESYNENRDKIRLSGMSRHEFRKFAFSHVKENWDVAFRDILPGISLGRKALNFSMLSAKAHNEMLQKDIEPESRVSSLESLSWKIFDTDKDLIFPDCIGIAYDHEEGNVPLVFSSVRNLRGAIFPITSSRAVCGGLYLDNDIRNAAMSDFQSRAAESSWEFFISDPTTKIEQSMQFLIGAKISNAIVSSIEEALQDAIIGGINYK